MAKYKSIVTTEVGLALVEDSAYMGHAIQFTALKTGNGVYDGTENLAEATDLKNVCQTFGVGSVSKRGSDILVRAAMNNSGVAAGYSITEIGLYATDPDTDTEVLYAIIVAESGNEDYFPPYAEAPTSITLEMYIGLTEAAGAVTFEVLPVAGTYVPVESFNELLDGTTPVGDSNKLGGKDASEYVLQSAVDNIQSMSRATLSTEGWYRVAKFASNFNFHSCDISIVSRYGSDGCSNHQFRVKETHSNARIEPLSTMSSANSAFTKVRLTTDGTNKYVEVYYAFNSSNNVTFQVSQSVMSTYGSNELVYWKAMNFEATSETVSGVTVTTTYNIPSNASPFTTSGGRIKGTVHLGGEELDAQILTYTSKNRQINTMISGDGDFIFQDATNSKRIFESTQNGTNTFNGTANGNLPLSGGTISGDVIIKKSGQPRFFVHSADTDRYGQFYTNAVGQVSIFSSLKSNDVAENQMSLILSPPTDTLANLLRLNRQGTVYKVFGEHNKPSGTYTGNATLRTISTGGIGSVVMIRETGSTNHIFVDKSGFFGVRNSAFVYGSGASTNSACEITLASDFVFNTSGKTYEYQVL